jgi:hypothetical protein
MKTSTQKRIVKTVVIGAGIFTAHQLIKRFLFEDTGWLYSTPDWILFVGASIIVAVCVRIIWNVLLRGTPIDSQTRRIVHRITED